MVETLCVLKLDRLWQYLKNVVKITNLATIHNVLEQYLSKD
jgi:aminoglycoside/choline kinase family phosphotransferase